MKVLNLQCHFKHDFEGWFGSEADFQNQLSKEMIECPICASREITKMLSAPRLNLGASAPQSESDPESQNKVTTPTLPGQEHPVALKNAEQNLAGNSLGPSNVDFANLDSKQLQKAWLQMVQHVIANTEDVGTQFVSEARKMHYGETQERSIRGQATADETQELLEEGISVLPLPIPSAIKGTIQ